MSAVAEAMALGVKGVVLDVVSLKNGCRKDELEELATLLRRHNAAVLLLTTGVDEPENQFLQALTNGVVRGVKYAGNAGSVGFPTVEGNLSGELSSQSYARKQSEALGLTIGSGAEDDVVMKLDQAPSFVRVHVGRASVFVWSTERIFDVFQPLAAEKEFEEAADEYIPAIIFLRFAFGERCWHNPRVGAGIVIDDPLLRKNYGFIDFPQLLASARKHGYHITLAFIPWNHWRSRAKEVQLFIDHADCFSICAHGCDHTKNEFGSADYASLLRKNVVARERMERHGQRTGLGSEPLMVCPQEQYSLEAMRAFSDSRQFLGLVNTACIPRNLTTPQVCAADLLLPAQDSFFGFPVFKRHYWQDMSAFAMGLFLGKPAILVEHHEFFRHGPAGVEEFVLRLAEIRRDVEWTSISETATRTHLQRRVAEGRREVRFFTDTFQLEHGLAEPSEYQLFRRMPDTTAVKRVVVNGKGAPFSRDDGYLTFEVRADRAQVLNVQVVVPPVEPTKAYSYELKYQASVACRRGLSELRDNVIARNPFALKVATVLMKSMRQQGG